MKPDRRVAFLFAASMAFCGCGTPAKQSGADLLAAPWDKVVQQARGTEVAFAMWTGDEARNRFFRNEAARMLKDKFDLTLRIVPLGDTVEAVNKLLNEKAAGKRGGGSIDFVWINGENFRSAKQGGILWGPFAGLFPNIGLYDDAVRQRDFGTLIEDFEAPWQQAQFVMGYDSARVKQLPRSLDELRSWIRQHPGRFTYIAPPDFTGSAFVRHVLLYSAGRDPGFWTGFNEDLYRRASAAAIAYLNGIKPYLWRKGETYPPSLNELHRLFVNNEVDFTMSYGPSFASVRIARGEFPGTARTFVFDGGTLGNYSFLAIPFNAGNPAGAMVAINELMSFEATMAMSKTFDPTFPHRLGSLTAEQRAQVNAFPRDPATLSAETLGSHFMPEPDAEYLNRFDKDWNVMVLRQ